MDNHTSTIELSKDVALDDADRMVALPGEDLEKNLQLAEMVQGMSRGLFGYNAFVLFPNSALAVACEYFEDVRGKLETYARWDKAMARVWSEVRAEMDARAALRAVESAVPTPGR